MTDSPACEMPRPSCDRLVAPATLRTPDRSSAVRHKGDKYGTLYNNLTHAVHTHRMCLDLCTERRRWGGACGPLPWRGAVRPEFTRFGALAQGWMTPTPYPHPLRPDPRSLLCPTHHYPPAPKPPPLPLTPNHSLERL